MAAMQISAAMLQDKRAAAKPLVNRTLESRLVVELAERMDQDAFFAGRTLTALETGIKAADFPGILRARPDHDKFTREQSRNTAGCSHATCSKHIDSSDR